MNYIKLKLGDDLGCIVFNYIECDGCTQRLNQQTFEHPKCSLKIYTIYNEIDLYNMQYIYTTKYRNSYSGIYVDILDSSVRFVVAVQSTIGSLPGKCKPVIISTCSICYHYMMRCLNIETTTEMLIHISEQFKIYGNKNISTLANYITKEASYIQL